MRHKSILSRGEITDAFISIRACGLKLEQRNISSEPSVSVARHGSRLCSQDHHDVVRSRDLRELRPGQLQRGQAGSAGAVQHAGHRRAEIQHPLQHGRSDRRIPPHRDRHASRSDMKRVKHHYRPTIWCSGFCQWGSTMISLQTENKFI